MAGGLHAHTLLIPDGYTFLSAYMEKWVFGELLVSSTHHCTPMIWLCGSTDCLSSFVSGTLDPSSGPYDQDAST